jgi:hypothetical protein
MGDKNPSLYISRCTQPILLESSKWGIYFYQMKYYMFMVQKLYFTFTQSISHCCRHFHPVLAYHLASGSSACNSTFACHGATKEPGGRLVSMALIFRWWCGPPVRTRDGKLLQLIPWRERCETAAEVIVMEAWVPCEP